MGLAVVAVGDAIVTGSGLRTKVDERLVELFAGADVRFANAEFTCPAPSTPPAPLDRHYSLAVDDWVIDELLGVGINLVSVANNHTGDFGWQGVVDTLAACEAKGLICAGAGRSLREARRPAFVQTAQGRVGLVAAASSSAYEMLASDPGAGVAARPGTSPLRVVKSYVLQEQDFRFLQDLDERLGTASTRRGRDRLGFVGGFERKVTGSSFGFAGTTVRLGDASHIVMSVDESDIGAMCAAVEDAARRCDVVVASLHCHEGVDDGWNTPVAAGFVEYCARRLVDAGARAVFGHGPHMIRGIEVYHGAPIFYSLGNFVFEFEMMERVPPEMYLRYGLPADATPSELHYLIRARDRSGTWRGFYADPNFWEGFLARCVFTATSTEVELTMLSLGFQDERAVRRGMPQVAEPAHAKGIADRLAALSEPYGTAFDVDPRTGTVRFSVRAEEAH